MEEILTKAALAGGQILKKYYKTKLQITEKASPEDLVTQADKESQQAIVSSIEQSMIQNGFNKNEIGFIAEENFTKNANHLFIIDPLDGTSNFVDGRKRFSISIAYVREGKILAGLVLNPTTDKIFFAEKDKGAFKKINNEKQPLKIIEKDLINSDFIYNRSMTTELAKQVTKVVERLRSKVNSISKSRGAVLNLMDVVENKAQLLISSKVFIWDIAASKLILEEAGGTITDWQGNEMNLDFSLSDKEYKILAGSRNKISETISLIDQNKIILIGSMTNSLATYDNEVKKRFGGGVSYGGKTASKLGIEATIITIGADDLEPGLKDLRKLGLEVIRIKRDVSNNYSNDYRGGQRKLYMRSRFKEHFSANDFPQRTNCDALVIFPGLDEVQGDISSFFNAKIVFLDVGGLSRKLEEKNKDGLFPIVQGNWNSIDEFRGKVDILKVSHEDLENIRFEGINTTEGKIQNLAENGFPIVVLTRGEKPTLLSRKEMPILEVKTFKVKNFDPAGAGEAFSVAFIDEFLKTDNPVKATAFANSAASFHVAKEDYNYEKAEKRAEELNNL